MTKVLNFGQTWRYVQDHSVLEYVQDTHAFLKIELGNVEKDRGLIKDVRGNGTYIGFDVVEVDQTDSMMRWLLKRGIVASKTGPQTIGIRPALTLGPSHAKHLREAVKYFNPNHD